MSFACMNGTGCRLTGLAKRLRLTHALPRSLTVNETAGPTCVSLYSDWARLAQKLGFTDLVTAALTSCMTAGAAAGALF